MAERLSWLADLLKICPTSSRALRIFSVVGTVPSSELIARFVHFSVSGPKFLAAICLASMTRDQMEIQ